MPQMSQPVHREIKNMQWEIPQCVRFLTAWHHRYAASPTRETQCRVEVVSDSDIRQKSRRHDALAQLRCKLLTLSEQRTHALNIQAVGAGMRVHMLDAWGKTCTRLCEERTALRFPVRAHASQIRLLILSSLAAGTCQLRSPTSAPHGSQRRPHRPVARRRSRHRRASATRVSQGLLPVRQSSEDGGRHTSPHPRPECFRFPRHTRSGFLLCGRKTFVTIALAYQRILLSCE